MTVKDRFTWIQKVLFTFFVFSLLSIFLLSYSLITIFPPLKVKYLEINIQNKKILQLIKNLLATEYNNNFLLIFVNQDFIEEELKKSTDFYIRRVEIKGFDWFHGRLSISVSTEKPFAVLNNKYLISNRGIIFGFIPPKGKIYLNDYSQPWTYGETYNTIDVNTLKFLLRDLSLKRIDIVNDLITLKGSKLTLRLPLYVVKNKAVLLRVRDNIRTLRRVINAPVSIAILGKKGTVYIKIFKGSKDE